MIAPIRVVSGNDYDWAYRNAPVVDGFAGGPLPTLRVARPS